MGYCLGINVLSEGRKFEYRSVYVLEGFEVDLRNSFLKDFQESSQEETVAINVAPLSMRSV